MVRTKKVDAASQTVDDTLADALDMPSLPFETESAEDVMEKEATVPVDERYGPPMWHESWNDWVLRQFSEGEMDSAGRPLVHGLRRVCRKVLGPILFSGPLTNAKVEYANNEPEAFTRLAPVSVFSGLKILWSRPEDGPPFEVEFREMADVMTGNCDREFLRFASSTASTRAEARCLRKALQIKVVSSEETTNVSDEDASPDGYIRASQIIFLEAICKRKNVDIDLAKFVNSGSKRFDCIHNIPIGTAEKMLESLNSFQNQPAKIPPELKGFKTNWKETLRYES